MKLRELREMIDALDDEARKKGTDEDVVLELENNDSEREAKIEIGHIFKSKLSGDTIKVEPKEELERTKPARRILKDRDIVAEQTNYFCPNCGRRVGKNDNFCRSCGQKMITSREQAREERAEKREEARKKRALAREKRALAREKKALEKEKRASAKKEKNIKKKLFPGKKK